MSPKGVAIWDPRDFIEPTCPFRPVVHDKNILKGFWYISEKYRYQAIKQKEQSKLKIQKKRL